MQKSFSFRQSFLQLFLLSGLCAGFVSCRFGNPSSQNGQEVEEDSVYHSERLSQLTDSIQKHPDSAKLYYERGALLYITKDYPRAKKDLQQAILLDPLESAYFTALGQLFLSQHFLDSARLNFYKAIAIDHSNSRARLQLAYTLLNQEKYQAAILQTDTLLAKNPELTQALGLQSQAYEALGNKKKALQIMRKVMKLPPVSYNALMRMGDLLLDQNKPEAVYYYKKAAAVDSTAAEPYYCMGLLYEQQNEDKEAITAYNQCIEKDIQYYKAYLKLGKLYEKGKDWKKAGEIFNLAIKINPASSEAYYHRGLAREKMNQKEAAVRDYEQALIFNEDNKLAKAALNRLN